MSCPEGFLTTEQVNVLLTNEGLKEQFRFTTAESLSKITEFIQSIPLFTKSLSHNTDLVIHYLKGNISYLVEFSNSCSNSYFWFDGGYTTRFMQMLGGTL